MSNLTLSSHFKLVIYSVHREEVYSRCPHLKRIEMRIPIFHDGKPANLPAAILDAEYWLRWLRSQINDAQLPAEAEMKRTVSVGLRSAIEALEEFLPYEELSPEWGLTPAQQAKANLIKEKLRARQQAMRAAE